MGKIHNAKAANPAILPEAEQRSNVYFTITGSEKEKCRKRNNPPSNMDTHAGNLKWALPSLFIKSLDYLISPYHKVQCLCKLNILYAGMETMRSILK
jgi:hypothetical protein